MFEEMEISSHGRFVLLSKSKVSNVLFLPHICFSAMEYQKAEGSKELNVYMDSTGQARKHSCRDTLFCIARLETSKGEIESVSNTAKKAKEDNCLQVVFPTRPQHLRISCTDAQNTGCCEGPFRDV